MVRAFTVGTTTPGLPGQTTVLLNQARAFTIAASLLLESLASEAGSAASLTGRLAVTVGCAVSEPSKVTCCDRSGIAAMIASACSMRSGLRSEKTQRSYAAGKVFE